MVDKKRVCVIGAGVSGLAAAKAFAAKGHEIVILERGADLGGVWEASRRYPDVQTQSAKSMYRFTDAPMPENYPEWPRGEQVEAYLHDYAERNNLRSRARFGANVEAMQRRPDGKPGWRLDISGVGGAKTTEDYDFVAICTGQFSDKNVPDHPGVANFIVAGGQILHSSGYRDPAQLAGKRVIVLGGSKSATDIAVSAVKAGALATTLVYRQPRWRVPYYIAGLVNFKFIVFMRAQEQLFRGWNLSPFAKTMQSLCKPLIWANWRAFEAILKLQLGLKKCDMVPEERIEDAVNCAFPVVTPDFYPMIRDGRIKAIRSAFAGYEPGAVSLSNGERVSADVAILATGWRIGAPILPQEFRDKLIDPDGQYRLYRFIANPDLPDMGFVGFNSSFATLLTSEISAHWLVRYADGQLARQPSADEMNRDIEMMRRYRRVERPAASVYNGLCVAPFHFRHLDELIADMGASLRSRGFTERLLPLDAQAFGRYLASMPEYAAG